MPGKSQILGYAMVAPRMILVYFLVYLWESATVSAVRPNDNYWKGVSFSVMLLPIGAFHLAAFPGASSRFFVYGVFGSLLFVPRFLSLDHVHINLPTEIVACYLFAFALALGFVCWFAGMLRQPIARNPESPLGHEGNLTH